MAAATVETVGEKLSTIKVNGVRPSEKAVRKVAGRYNVELGNITTHNVLQLKKLNEAVFPVAYNDKFYIEVTSAGDLAKIAYFNDVVVGAVCCRYETMCDEKSLYIMTLGTLAPYRRYGVGKLLLDHVFEHCEKDPSIKRICLHVQVNNTTALEFYDKHGFENKELCQNYYRLEPSEAYLLVKKIN
ncbi:unnamed protein product [Caenorhabditis auriculariae]|uniref:N-terminal methionine N(alpha)-acetyltransferase NatE n=1 Tax=Caenorhabditis auriculariae TaxID=2777116 RepID=A0A8S1GWU5_9PELO|nr:unnamed protein product [Caenorhabditis auriculariae]